MQNSMPTQEVTDDTFVKLATVFPGSPGKYKMFCMILVTKGICRQPQNNCPQQNTRGWRMDEKVGRPLVRWHWQEGWLPNVKSLCPNRWGTGSIPTTNPYTIPGHQTLSRAGKIYLHFSGSRGLMAPQRDGVRQQWGQGALCPMNWNEEVTQQVRRLF